VLAAINVIYVRQWTIRMEYLPDVISFLEAVSYPAWMDAGRNAVLRILQALADCSRAHVFLPYIGLTQRSASRRWTEEYRMSLSSEKGSQRTLSFAIAYLSKAPGVIRDDLVLCCVQRKLLHPAEATMAHVLHMTRTNSINRAPCGGDSQSSSAQPIYDEDETTVLSQLCTGAMSQHPGTRLSAECFDKSESLSSGLHFICKSCRSAHAKKVKAQESAASGVSYTPYRNATGG
jgi:hypothetical protein